MKLKLFLVIWISFLFSITGSTFVYTELLRRDRIRSMDTQIESLAGIVASSELIGENLADLKEADEIIRNVMGGYRLGLVMIVRNRSGKIIYQNHNAERLLLDPSIATEWQSIESEDYVIRMYRTFGEGKRTILQLGLIMNKSLLAPLYSGPTAIRLGMTIFILSGVLSFLLTQILLRPLRKLGDYLNEMAEGFHSSGVIEKNLPRSLELKSRGKYDELSLLIKSIQNFFSYLTSAYRLNLAHSSQLAHEIKTPLTVIRNRLDQPEKAIEQIDQLAQFVDRYLQWGESVNRPVSDTELFALHLDRFLEDVLKKLSFITEDRVKLEIKNPLRVFANAGDLEHLLTNLIQNALKYSDGFVHVELIDSEVRIRDHGPGIPERVLSRLGEPFNSGEGMRRGKGLGLSLVHLICKKYRWDFQIESSDSGTTIHIRFPKEDDSLREA